MGWGGWVNGMVEMPQGVVLKKQRGGVFYCDVIVSFFVPQTIFFLGATVLQNFF